MDVRRVVVAVVVAESGGGVIRKSISTILILIVVSAKWVWDNDLISCIRHIRHRHEILTVVVADDVSVRIVVSGLKETVVIASAVVVDVVYSEKSSSTLHQWIGVVVVAIDE